jgi:hypothetical protein
MSAQYFAQLNENNVVTYVAVVTAEYIEENPIRYPGVWVETFIDLPNKTYAGVGYTYDLLTQDFIAPVDVAPIG